MRPHLWLLVVTLFFLTMNLLLWRSQVSDRAMLGSAIRPQVVWERMLHSSDFSDLEIRHRQQKIGRCRWTPSQLGEDDQPARRRRRPAPEGMVQRLRGYVLDLDGDLTLRDLPRLRFELQLKLATNYAWTDLVAEFTVHPRGQPRPPKLTLRANAARQVLTLSPPLFSEGDDPTQESIPLKDLRDPAKLLRRLAGPEVAAALTALGLPLSPAASFEDPAPLTWQATKGHRLRLRSLSVSVYGLSTRLLGRYPIALYVTETGEIFRVELPNEVTLVNEKLLSL